jgi:hypothetical protein
MLRKVSRQDSLSLKAYNSDQVYYSKADIFILTHKWNAPRHADQLQLITPLYIINLAEKQQ